MIVNKTKKIELRSPEVQELIGHLPKGFVRYGIGLILSLLLIVLLICNNIPYENEQMISIKVLPNIRLSKVVSIEDAVILHNNIQEEDMVALGDTLLILQINEKKHYITSPNSGIAHFCRFCIPNDTVKMGEELIEISNIDCMNNYINAVVESIPKSFNISELKRIKLVLNGASVDFSLKQVLEEQNSCTKSLWFQSDFTTIEILHSFSTNFKVKIADGNLLNKLVQIKF